MKTRNIILLALSAIFTAACHTWDEPSVVEGRNSYGNQYLQESNVVTVADLKADFKDVISSGSLKQVTKPTQIKVIVTGNDEGSNIYKTLYVADKTGGISLSINKSGIFSEAPVGQCMLIELKDLYIGGYGQQPQIGILYQKDENTQQVGRMDRYTWQEHFKLLPAVKGLSVKPIKTNDMGMLDLDRDFGKVVTLVGVTMKDADGVKVFAPSDGSVKLSGGCANREVANQSTTVYVRTSTYAKFATMAMPTEKINITGILSRFANDVQIMPRTIDDIQPYDGLDYESTWKPTDPEGDGSQAKPFNVTAAIAKCQEVGATVSSQKYYIKGYVAADAEVNSQYGNITFEMADSKDGGVRFTAYQMAGSDGKKLASTFKVSKGDEVLIYGAIYNYNSSKPETEGQGKSIIVSVNGKDTNGKSTDSGSGDNPSGETAKYGTAEAPLTVAQAIAAIDAESTISEAYVKGKISKIDSYNATYKSITYWISDDGGTTTQLQVYSGKGLNGADFTAKENLTVGQTVVIKGALKKYNTTYEFDKSSEILSIGSESGDETAKHGTAEAPLTVAQAIAAIDAESTISEAYVKGKISKIDSYNATYKSITYWISDDGTTTTQLQVYSGKGLNGADFSSKDDLTVGKTVIIKGALKKYNSTYEFDKTSSILSIQ